LSWRDFEAWLDAPAAEQAPKIPLHQPGDRQPGVTAVARQKLVASAAGRSSGGHADALLRLADATPVFVASGMEREAQTARCEAAGHLIELCAAHEARSLLDRPTFSEHGQPSKLGFAARAKLSVALMDLRLGREALGIAGTVSPMLCSADDLPRSRLLRRALVLCLDVLMAASLATSRRIETALAECMPPGELPTGQGCSRMLADALQAAQRDLPADADLESLGLLHASLAGEAGVADQLQDLTQRLSAKTERHPLAWLRLCVAHRLAARPLLAAHCASEAISAALATGSLRSQQLALREAALIQSETGQAAALADTWRALRALDRAVWKARADYEVLRPAMLAQMQPAGIGVAAPAGRPGPRASHVETAIARLKAEPSRPWKVGALAEAAGVSRRTLEQAFRLHSDLSVAEVIREHRVQRALLLLRLSDHAIKRVAIEAGYSSASTLCREMREQTGLSPGQIRLEHRRGG
jgi:AraC-like DNA-binding protein